MNVRPSAVLVAVLLALSALSIVFADVPVARWVAGLPAGVHGFFGTGTGWLDTLSGKRLDDGWLGLGLTWIALLVALRPAWRPLARVLVLVALTNTGAHFAAGLLKPVFGRLRPYEIEASGWVDRFFTGGTSFPSGHAAFYWGLLLPLAWGLPRWRIPLLLPALFVVVARVLENRHFVGDVLAGMALALAVSSCLCALLRRFGKLAPLGGAARGA